MCLPVFGHTGRMDQTSITLPAAIDTFGVVDRYRIQLALVPFVEITAPLDAATKRRVQRKMLVTAATVALVLIVLGELLRVLLHLTVGCPVDRRRRDLALPCVLNVRGVG